MSDAIFTHEKLYKINHVRFNYKSFSLKCKNNLLNLMFYLYCNNIVYDNI